MEVKPTGTKCFVCDESLVFVTDAPERCPFCGENNCVAHEDEPAALCCEEVLNGDHIYWAPGYEEAFICGWCRDTLLSYANTVMVMTDDDAVSVHYHSGIIIDLEEVMDALPGEMVHLIVEIVTGTSWKATDGWRGYESVPENLTAWCRVLDGWHSSMETSQLSQTVTDLWDRKIPLPFPLIVVVTKTSNICALGISMYCREDDADRAKGFFKDLDPGAGDVAV